MFLLKRLGPANETQSLIQRRVSPFFLQTSLNFEPKKLASFLLPPSFSPSFHSLARSLFLTLSPWPRWSCRGNQRVKAPARRFLWLVLFSSWFCAWKHHRKTESGTKADQARLQVSFVNVCIKSLAPVLLSSSPGPELRLPACSREP